MIDVLQMVVIFNDDFESGSFSAWTANYGSPTVDNLIYHGGNHAMKCTGQPDMLAQQVIAVRLDVYCRLYVYFASLPAAGHFVDVLDLTNPDPYEAQSEVGVYNDGGVVKWCFRRPPLATPPEYLAASGPSIGQWYCVEERVRAVGVAPWTQTTEAWIDGVLTFQDSYAAANSEGTTDIWVGGGDKNEAVTNYIDDVIVADSYIGTQSLVGTLKVTHIKLV